MNPADGDTGDPERIDGVLLSLVRGLASRVRSPWRSTAPPPPPLLLPRRSRFLLPLLLLPPWSSFSFFDISLSSRASSRSLIILLALESLRPPKGHWGGDPANVATGSPERIDGVLSPSCAVWRGA